MKILKFLFPGSWSAPQLENNRKADPEARREKFLREQKEQIKPKLEEFSYYLARFDSVEFIMLAYDGYQLTLAGGFDLKLKIDFELNFQGVDRVLMNKTFRLRGAVKPIMLDGYNENDMIIKLNDESGQAHIIECEGFDFKIIEGEYLPPLIKSKNKELAQKIAEVNHFFANRNVNDICVAYYDGHQLSLVASFDLCYYHDIKLLFKDLKKLDLNFFSYAGYSDEGRPFISLGASEAGSLKFIFAHDDNIKSSIICGDFDYKIETVKYFDRLGRPKRDIIY